MTRDELIIVALAAWNSIPVEDMRANLSEAQKSPLSMESWGRVVDAILNAQAQEIKASITQADIDWGIEEAKKVIARGDIR